MDIRSQRPDTTNKEEDSNIDINWPVFKLNKKYY